MSGEVRVRRAGCLLAIRSQPQVLGPAPDHDHMEGQGDQKRAHAEDHHGAAPAEARHQVAGERDVDGRGESADGGQQSQRLPPPALEPVRDHDE